jgi:GT2 family glycosyltransferase
MDEGQFGSEREIFGAPGAAPLISHRLIADLSQNGGLFDESFFMYAEDTDLDWRARLRGWQCWFTPHALAIHRGSRPDGEMKAQAVANRYLSVIKNAYLQDLVFYNLPIMIAHCVARLIVSPGFGWQITRQLFSRAAGFWGKRTKPAIERSRMLDWFKWSEQQMTSQPTSFVERLKSYSANISNPPGRSS